MAENRDPDTIENIPFIWVEHKHEFPSGEVNASTNLSIQFSCNTFAMFSLINHGNVPKWDTYPRSGLQILVSLPDDNLSYYNKRLELQKRDHFPMPIPFFLKGCVVPVVYVMYYIALLRPTKMCSHSYTNVSRVITTRRREVPFVVSQTCAQFVSHCSVSTGSERLRG